MVGRTPEYFGEENRACGEQNDHALRVGRATGGSATHRDCREATRLGLSGLTSTRSAWFHGILFAFTSCFANNGQSFASLSANTRFYNLTTSLAMTVGRFGLAIPA